MPENNDASTLSGTPGFAKAIILVQTLVILFLSFWLYQEYQNNPYLQTYVNSTLQGTNFIILSLVTLTGFSTVALFLYRKLREAHRELDEVLSNESVRKTLTSRPGFLDSKTEQHLIDMIRRTDGTPQAPTEGMPVLKRVDSEDNTKTP